MDFGNQSQAWFALQVRTRWESSTAGLLVGKGYKTLNPTYRAKKLRSDGLKEITTPLFPGYLFCQFDVQKRLPVLITPGVIAVVSRGRVPVPVAESEIASIETIITRGLRAEPCPYLQVGQKIRIQRDALSGLEGILIHFKGNHRIVVSVSLLHRSVALEVDESCVTPLDHSRTTAGQPIGSFTELQEMLA